jgi:2-dehydro-3-deoxy-D-arabinonate dehydratase
MKIYNTKKGIFIERNNQLYPLENEDWDSFINDDDLYDKITKITGVYNPIDNTKNILDNLKAPIQSQELWAAGVTYSKSKEERQEESKDAGGGDFYARVYEAERPELFFKGNRNRIVSPGGNVRIRRDSPWNVPEPELTLVITSSGKIVGYTIGNDMSSRSIEGENPLYLPQAKTYDGCAALGPCVLVTEEALPSNTAIHLEIKRKNSPVFEGNVEINQMKRNLKELVSFLYRECSFPKGSMLMTGTGIVPDSNFTLQSGDEILITIESIGTLKNKVE